MAQRAFTQQNITNIAVAGAGAVSAGILDVIVPLNIPSLAKNLMVVGAGAFIAVSGQGPMRFFGVGLGSVGVANIIRNNLLLPVG